ncbi:hypothetical protein ABPG72_019046 [Tetrahymena utriculariae]
MPTNPDEASYVKESSQFREDLFSSTSSLFKGDDQEYIVIWGNLNFNLDTQKINGLEKKYPFFKERIYRFEKSNEFRMKSIELAEKNILFLMTGQFANHFLDGLSNLEWVNNKIVQKKVHSKSIIIFATIEIIKQNKWSIENLQQKFKYVTQLVDDFDRLFASFDKMIYNRIHRSFAQNSHLDYYFRADIQSILKIFQKPQSHSFKDLKKSPFRSQFNQLCDYVKTQDVQSPLKLYLKNELIEQTIQYLELCFQENGAQNNEIQIVKNFIKLYTKQTPVYKILNFALNTMNPQIYKYLETIFKLLSKCLYQYDDKQTQSKIKLYRGAVVQKYQYYTMYQEYKHNLSKNDPTFITFPQFMSTTTDEDVAKSIINDRQKQVEIETMGRMNLIDEFSLVNKQYLISEEFIKAYKVVIYINAQFDPKNNFRPKSISDISEFSYEKEYLFQPFQTFRIDSMQEDISEGQNLCIYLTYIL